MYLIHLLGLRLPVYNSEVISHQDFNFTSFIDVMSMIPSSSPVNEAHITQTDSNCLSILMLIWA